MRRWPGGLMWVGEPWSLDHGLCWRRACQGYPCAGNDELWNGPVQPGQLDVDDLTIAELASGRGLSGMGCQATGNGLGRAGFERVHLLWVSGEVVFSH